MINLGSILKSRHITLPKKVHIVRAMVLTVVMYGCESWTINKVGSRKTDALKLQCWRRVLSVLWTARRCHMIHRADSSENEWERLNAVEGDHGG